MTPFYLFIYLFNLFIFGCVGSSLLRTGLLQLRRVGATPRCSVRAPHCGGLSCRGPRALGARASVVVVHWLSSCGSWAVEHRLGSCDARAQLLHGMWDPPGPGLEPMSPALAGGLSTTAPPGKPDPILFRKLNKVISLEEVEIFIKELPHKKHQAQVVSQGNSTKPSKTR